MSDTQPHNLLAASCASAAAAASAAASTTTTTNSTGATKTSSTATCAINQSSNNNTTTNNSAGNDADADYSTSRQQLAQQAAEATLARACGRMSASPNHAAADSPPAATSAGASAARKTLAGQLQANTSIHSKSHRQRQAHHNHHSHNNNNNNSNSLDQQQYQLQQEQQQRLSLNRAGCNSSPMHQSAASDLSQAAGACATPLFAGHIDCQGNWNQYQQAIAAAFATSRTAANLTGSTANAGGLAATSNVAAPPAAAAGAANNNTIVSLSNQHSSINSSLEAAAAVSHSQQQRQQRQMLLVQQQQQRHQLQQQQQQAAEMAQTAKFKQQQNLLAQLINLSPNAPAAASLLVSAQAKLANLLSGVTSAQDTASALLPDDNIPTNYHTQLNSNNSKNNICNQLQQQQQQQLILQNNQQQQQLLIANMMQNYQGDPNGNLASTMAALQQAKLGSLAAQLCNTLNNHQFNSTTSSNYPLDIGQQQHLFDMAVGPKSSATTTSTANNKHSNNDANRYNPMRSAQPSQVVVPKLKSATNSSRKQTLTPGNDGSGVQQSVNKRFNSNRFGKDEHNARIVGENYDDFSVTRNSPAMSNSPTAATSISASSLANLISLTASGQLQLLQPHQACDILQNPNTTNLLNKLTSSLANPQVAHSYNPVGTPILTQTTNFDNTSERLLESLYAMNDDPEDDALQMISQRLNSSKRAVSDWFKLRRQLEKNVSNTLNLTTSNGNPSFNYSLTNPDNQSPVNNNMSSPGLALNQQHQQHQYDSNCAPNPVFNYSNIQKSILESVLASATVNDRYTENISDTRMPNLDHSENGSHPETFDESDDEELDPTDDILHSSKVEDLSNSHRMNSTTTSNQFISNVINNSVNGGQIDLYSSNPFLSMINSKSQHSSPNDDNKNISFGAQPVSYKTQQPSVPSSSLLAKLTAVTSRPKTQFVCGELDEKMLDLLEAFYAINDNPEPAAIEMIARRINTTSEVIGDWFDRKRLETSPQNGPRSPPMKKREGGRVVTFSEYQRSLLEAIFDENNYLHPQEYEELSNLIQVPSRNIKIWFKNRRSKQRLSGRLPANGASSSD